MKTVELLAPAKNYETAVAAINCGADAVYIGANNFGARHNASNSLEDIEKIVKYAHKFYVRVHVTINTIIKDEELLKVIELIKKLYSIGVDAIIVQDMAIIKASIEHKIPPIQIHISTQCNNRNLEKAIFFDNVGASRIVLARELSINNIKEICKKTKCELETFIHGALCVSYSGQCYLSYANGGRSANRGECAQPCRKLYSLVNAEGTEIIKDKYLLSLKDFNADQYLKNLVDIGVNSFKIEGRLKDINYVKNVVLYYYNSINAIAKHSSSGKVFTDFVPDINKTFNREYTTYFLNKRTDCYNYKTPKFMGECLGKIKKIGKDYFILENNYALTNQDGLCFINSTEIDGFLVNKVVGSKIYPNRMTGLEPGITLYRNNDELFNKKLNSTVIKRKILVNFTITDNGIFVQDEDFNRVSINFNRNEVPKDKNKVKESYIKQLNKTGNTDYYCEKIIFKTDNFPFLSVSEINSFRRSLLEKLDEIRLKNYPKIAQNPMKYANFYQDEIDYRGNVSNKEAKELYKNCNCKVSQYALEVSTNIPHNIELMRTKHCIKYAFGYCHKDLEKLYLLDKQSNKKYPLKFDCTNCEMVVLSP